MEKRRGASASLYLRRTRPADEVGSDAIPDAAGGEGGHGAAKPEGVIHRYGFNLVESSRKKCSFPLPLAPSTRVCNKM